MEKNHTILKDDNKFHPILKDDHRSFEVTEGLTIKELDLKKLKEYIETYPEIAAQYMDELIKK